MSVVTVKELLEAGVHFGHPASRWHPRMAPYIFTKRNGVHIVDVRKTAAAMVEAHCFLKKIVSGRGTILFVGTKRQAKDAIRREATRAKMPFVAERWLGGTLTNLETIRQQIKRLEEIERIEQSGESERFSKKMLASFRRERRKVVRNLEGIRSMTSLPDVLLIVDPKVEKIAVREAKSLRIPVVAILDTDCNPKSIDIPVPANDDAMRSIDLILNRLTDSIVAGKEGGTVSQVSLASGFSTADLEKVASGKIAGGGEDPSLDEASQKESAETLAEAPAEAPAETPAEVPAETPAEVPAEAPSDASAEEKA